MTRPFRSILVDIDENATAQPALELAARLARRCGARLHVVDTGSRRDVEGGRRRAASRFGSGVDARPPTPEERLIDEVKRGGHDLVVRAQARDLAGRGRSVNARLFRHCPCPVWAAGAAPLPARPKVLAAVSADLGDAESDALNARVVEMARGLARLVDGSVTALHAWRPFAEKKVAARPTREELEVCRETSRERADRDLGRLVARFGVSRLELRQGLPEVVVPEFAVAEGTDVVVVGARDGVWRRVFGSTAERVLERAVCSVVAVKAPA